MTGGSGAAQDVLDPEVRQFVERCSKDYARHGAFDALPLSEARRVAEEVRAPWRRGGPAMRAIRELQVPAGEGSVRVRVYDPGGGSAGPRPVLIYMHGGGWMIFSLDTHDRLMREYAARSGLVVIGVDYSLSPEAKFPTALDEVVCVARWVLRGEAAAYRVDAGRVVLGGDSAGGNLALAAALTLRDGGGQQPNLAGVLLNYAALEPGCSDEAERRYGGAGFMLTRAELNVFWSNYLRTPADARDPRASVATARLAGLPPVLLAIAECDVLAEQNLTLAGRLAEAGVPVTTRVYRGATHSFLEAMSVSQLAQRALQESADWLRERTGAGQNVSPAERA
jgi:acetyl esterase